MTLVSRRTVLTLATLLPALAACIGREPAVHARAPMSAVRSFAAPAAPARTPARSPFRRMGDSASALLSHAVEASDTANVQALLAVSGVAPERRTSTLATAAGASRSANAAAGRAIAQGDRLRDLLLDPMDHDSQSYARYWTMGRARLDAARRSAARAATAADSAARCGARSCGSRMTRALRVHADSASGAAREAEAIVRIALTYVK